jgi:hypothetical protein
MLRYLCRTLVGWQLIYFTLTYFPCSKWLTCWTCFICLASFPYSPCSMSRSPFLVEMSVQLLYVCSTGWVGWMCSTCSTCLTHLTSLFCYPCWICCSSWLTSSMLPYPCWTCLTNETCLTGTTCLFPVLNSSTCSTCSTCLTRWTGSTRCPCWMILTTSVTCLTGTTCLTWYIAPITCSTLFD